VATALNNLALMLFAQGRPGEAEPLYRRSIAIQEKVLGAQHPDLDRSLDNYAALLRKQGRDGEARTFETRARDIRTRHAWDQPSR
jgi:hypothetical protein